MLIQSLRRGSMVLQFNELSGWFLWTVKLENPPLQFLGTLKKATRHRWPGGAMVCLPPSLGASYFQPDTQEFLASLPSEVGGCWWAHPHLREVFTGRPHHISEQRKLVSLLLVWAPSRSSWCWMGDSTSFSLAQLWAKPARSMFTTLCWTAPTTVPQGTLNWPISLIFKGRND